jgi:hypothetical protein
MLFSLSLLMLAQIVLADDPYGMRASGDAQKKWLDCAYGQVDKLSIQPESAREIAAAALSRCGLEESGYETTLMKKFTSSGQGVRGIDEARRQTRDLRARMEGNLISHVMVVREAARKLEADLDKDSETNE